MKDGQVLYHQYMKDFDHVLTNSEQIAPRGLSTRELPYYIFEAEENEIFDRPNLNIALGIVEGLSILAGKTAHEQLAKVAPKTYEEYFKGNYSIEYAEKCHMAISDMMYKLADDPYSRQLVAYIGNNDDIILGTNPCTESIQLLYRPTSLRLHVNMRSWDLFRGLPYDLIMWTVVLSAIRQIVHYQFAWITDQTLSFFCPTAHIYEKDIGPFRAHVQQEQFVQRFIRLEEGITSFDVAREWAQAVLAEGEYTHLIEKVCCEDD